ncbi:MAG TPA: SET domain-containing protein-lysine N-methyltransferase, partial [Polyangiaceae bacterium]|nr:SET domain-containing protein-lysine N-methyltransferase [Polyangiaceae bacterium]
LGYGSLYNHAREPNAMYVRKHEARSIAFFALRPIGAGEEITVSYHGGFGDRGDVWFDVRLRESEERPRSSLRRSAPLMPYKAAFEPDAFGAPDARQGSVRA